MRKKTISKKDAESQASSLVAEPETVPESDLSSIEDMPDFSLDLNPFDTKPSTRKISWEIMLYDVITEGRSAVFQVIDGFLIEVFKEIHKILKEQNVNEEEIYTLTGPVSGVTRLTLASVSKCTSENLAEYVLGSMKPRLQSQLLDIPTLSRDAFRTSYPQAFKKWEPEEDAMLTKLYKEGVSWYEISAKLQRNVNAVKLRIEKLGLAQNTGARHYFSNSSE